jgi:hypothetical protein
VKFPKKEHVKTIQAGNPMYYADIAICMGEYLITIGTYQGLTHYLINTTKSAKTFEQAEKIAKRWLIEYSNNPK